MNKKIINTILLVFISGLASAGAQTAEVITEKADAIFTLNKQLYQKSSMTITRGGKEQPVQIMDSYYMKEDGVSKSLTIFIEPMRVKGTAYLTIGDDLWVKFASTGRIRKMSSSAKKNSAGGSDFSYSDMGEGNEGFGVKYSSSLDGSENVNGEQCYRIILTPRKKGDEVYEKAVAYITEDDFRYIKLELYENGAHIKTMSFTDYKPLKNTKYPYTVRM
ncbi:MAG: outer membrane lipoprotein-sorting protein, partial [Spirochaetia bacterium]|nr:outer membrane lipoprotein-sorting protein [Spirochaetia bacterium]